MENKQGIDGYFDPFAVSLRELMAHNPKDGSITSPATLAEELGTSTQTISYYINGKRKPSYDNIIALKEFFGVSADYLLFHVESKNLDMHKKTGLSNGAITMLELAHKQSKDSDLTDVTGLLDSLLSDHDFYVFLEESQEQIDRINELEEMDRTEREKKYPGVNMPGYSKWYLVQKVNEFIFRQMEKHGLKIEL